MTVADSQMPFYVLCIQSITKEVFALCNDAFQSK